MEAQWAQYLGLNIRTCFVAEFLRLVIAFFGNLLGTHLNDLADFCGDFLVILTFEF